MSYLAQLPRLRTRIRAIQALKFSVSGSNGITMSFHPLDLKEFLRQRLQRQTKNIQGNKNITPLSLSCMLGNAMSLIILHYFFKWEFSNGGPSFRSVTIYTSLSDPWFLSRSGGLKVGHFKVTCKQICIMCIGDIYHYLCLYYCKAPIIWFVEVNFKSVLNTPI